MVPQEALWVTLLLLYIIHTHQDKSKMMMMWVAQSQAQCVTIINSQPDSKSRTATIVCFSSLTDPNQKQQEQDQTTQSDYFVKCEPLWWRGGDPGASAPVSSLWLWSFSSQGPCSDGRRRFIFELVVQTANNRT